MQKADAIVRFDCATPQDEDDSDVPIAIIARIPPRQTVVLKGFQTSHKRFCFRKQSEGAPALFSGGTPVDHGVIQIEFRVLAEPHEKIRMLGVPLTLKNRLKQQTTLAARLEKQVEHVKRLHASQMRDMEKESRAKLTAIAEFVQTQLSTEMGGVQSSRLRSPSTEQPISEWDVTHAMYNEPVYKGVPLAEDLGRTTEGSDLDSREVRLWSEVDPIPLDRTKTFGFVTFRLKLEAEEDPKKCSETQSPTRATET